MKKRNITRCAVSALLCVLLLCSLLPGVYAVDKTGSFIDAAEMETGSAQAQVTFFATVDATVAAALYDRETGRMRAAGAIEADSGGRTVLIQLPEARQAGDVLRAFLLDRASGASLAECWTDEEQGSVQVGDAVFFGHYEQDNDWTNGREPIQWRVLAVENGRALLISEYALDCERFHDRNMEVTWEECGLREWLNEYFLRTAFTEEERAGVLTVTVTAEENPAYDTDPGNDTLDQVFLLSIGEAQMYFADDLIGTADMGTSKDRACIPTEYAIANSNKRGYGWNGGCCVWWLRSPGSNTGNNVNAVSVRSNGTVNNYGSIVNSSGIAVRPALWINLNP